MMQIDPGNPAQMHLFAAACQLAPYIAEFRLEALNQPAKDWRSYDAGARQFYIDIAMAVLEAFLPTPKPATTLQLVPTDKGAA